MRSDAVRMTPKMMAGLLERRMEMKEGVAMMVTFRGRPGKGKLIVVTRGDDACIDSNCCARETIASGEKLKHEEACQALSEKQRAVTDSVRVLTTPFVSDCSMINVSQKSKLSRLLGISGNGGGTRSSNLTAISRGNICRKDCRFTVVAKPGGTTSAEIAPYILPQKYQETEIR